MVTFNRQTAILVALIAGGAAMFASDNGADQDRRVNLVPLAAPLFSSGPVSEALTHPPDLPPHALAIGPEGAFAEVVVLSDLTDGKKARVRRAFRTQRVSTPTLTPRRPVVISSEALDVPIPEPEPVLAELPRPATRTVGPAAVDRPADDRGKGDRGRRGGFRIGIRVASAGNDCRIAGPSATRFVFDRGRVGGIAFGGVGAVRF